MAVARAGAHVRRRPLVDGQTAALVGTQAAASRRWPATSPTSGGAGDAECGLAGAGGLDGLVNNAGIIRRDDAVDVTEAAWDEVMDVNLKTAFFLSQAFGRLALSRRSRGSIVNIASLLSFQGGIRVAAYTASKHGIAGITRILANEWAAKGINVNAVAPGYIVSNNTQALRADSDRSAAILARIPAGRWGTPGDIGGAVTFLLSPAAGYVHGTILPVDGGWLAR